MAGLARLTRSTHPPGFAEMVRDDAPAAPLSARERAMLVYAEALTRDPGAMREAHVVALREAGLRDEDILHLNLVCCYFAYANRLTLGLGVALEPESHGD